MGDFVLQAADILVTAGVGVRGASSGWGIFAGREPSEPHTTVTLFPSGGKNSDPKWLLDFPSLQARIRGAPGGWEAARVKALAVKNALLGLPSQTIDGDRWVSVTMIGDIIGLGDDEEDRPRFTVNFSLILEPASGGNRTSLL